MPNQEVDETEIINEKTDDLDNNLDNSNQKNAKPTDNTDEDLAIIGQDSEFYQNPLDTNFDSVEDEEVQTETKGDGDWGDLEVVTRDGVEVPLPPNEEEDPKYAEMQRQINELQKQVDTGGATKESLEAEEQAIIKKFNNAEAILKEAEAKNDTIAYVKADRALGVIREEAKDLKARKDKFNQSSSNDDPVGDALAKRWYEGNITWLEDNREKTVRSDTLDFGRKLQREGWKLSNPRYWELLTQFSETRRGIKTSSKSQVKSRPSQGNQTKVRKQLTSNKSQPTSPTKGTRSNSSQVASFNRDEKDVLQKMGLTSKRHVTNMAKRKSARLST